MKHLYFFALFISALLVCSSCKKEKTYEMDKLGILPNQPKQNSAPLLKEALQKIAQEKEQFSKITLRFQPGNYFFHEKGATIKEYYISNHDQDNPKKVGLAIEDMRNITIDGQGANFLFHGRMLPIAILNTTNCTLKNLHLDFKTPHITQIQVTTLSKEEGTTFKVAPWSNTRINKEGRFETYGAGWIGHPSWGIAFEEKTKRIHYNTGDIGFNLKEIQQIAPATYHAPHWFDKRLKKGTVVVMRLWKRPTPGLFLSHNKNTTIKNVQIHYAEGMGLLAQMCENITLDGFKVALRGKDDPRYFTTQADATHFSGCKGKITSINGLYEGMMDDAINIHGTYLSVIQRLDDHTLIGKYMHSQAWGFEWGQAGNKVQFIQSKTMELLDGINTITAITPYDKKEIKGAKEYKISFEQTLPKEIIANKQYGIENLEWTPEVYFANNTIRNNRARGALFSTPKRTVIENNLFDHTSGSAILLCGDCNGWFETGACREVIIQNNTFINALTSMYQFTEAIISIYPEIPDLAHQKSYFHGGKGKGVKIINNTFQIFDQPILYAKSLDGLIFKGNTITENKDYLPFHHNKKRFKFERVINSTIEE